MAELEVPSLYRVHEPPDEDKVEDFENYIGRFKVRLRTSTQKLEPKVFQRLLKKIDGKPEERLISYLMLRTMRKAFYTPDNTGHYALAAPIYTHFTSPIRRYPDLIVHRLLREVRRRGKPAAKKLKEREKELPVIAEHSSITERRAEDAERELVEWKKVRFMADKVGDVFTGFVTGVTGYGLYVELEAFFVEGLVHISSLADDYYLFSERTLSLRGESTGRMFRLGDRLEVQVARVDQERRKIDLAVAGNGVAETKPKKALPKGRRAGHRR
jgi:ribonuclease R